MTQSESDLNREIEACLYCGPSDIAPLKLAPPPWCIADGIGTVVCAGDDPSHPGQMLFTLRVPIFLGDTYPPEHLAECAAFIVESVNSRAAFEYMRNTLKEIRAYSTDITSVRAADEALEWVLDNAS